MSATAHPVNELLVLLARPAVLELLWTLREAPMRDAGDETAELLEELGRNDIVAYNNAWALTDDGRALADQLLALATWAQRRGV
jgi:hypothetical protein